MEYAVSIRDLKKKFDLPLMEPGGLLSYLPGGALFQKRFTDFWALKGVSLDVKKGSMIGILGRNGAGKSALLKIIAGILKPTAGEIRCHGRVAALLELGAGFHEELTGMENIFLNGAILGLSRSEIMGLVPEIVAFSGLADFIHTPIKRYSSGMQARLGFAVAVNVDPDVLLVDEVISVGDIEFQSRCIAKIGEFRGKGKTIILVTHEIDSANYLCDELVWLEDGRIRERGPSSKVAELYRRAMHSGDSEAVHIKDMEDWKSEPGRDFLKHIRFLDESGGEPGAFETGGTMIMEIPYDTGGRIFENPEVNVVVTRSDGVVITDIYSSDWGFEPAELKGEGVIRVRFEPLLLLKADYEVSVKIFERNAPEKVYACSYRRDGFRAATPGAHNAELVADVPCRWSLKEDG